MSIQNSMVIPGVRTGPLEELWDLAIREGATHVSRPSEGLYRCWRGIDEETPELVQIITLSFLDHWVMLNWYRNKHTDKIFEEETKKGVIENVFTEG